jgi:hypothetical protein
MPIDREKLIRRLIKLRKIYAPYEGEDKEICASLKKDAGDNGGNFQLVIDKQGKVSVSAPHDKKFKGKTWELDVEAFISATKATRDSLLKRGLVKEVDEYSGAYYGAVTVELFS